MYQEYHTRLSEDARWPKFVLQVSATDADTGDSGIVRYSLGGIDKVMFVINDITGEVNYFSCIWVNIQLIINEVITNINIQSINKLFYTLIVPDLLSA